VRGIKKYVVFRLEPLFKTFLVQRNIYDARLEMLAEESLYVVVSSVLFFYIDKFK